MNEYILAIFVILVAGGFSLLGDARLKRARRIRKKEMNYCALRFGYSYRPKGSFHTASPELFLFRRGYRYESVNVLSGTYEDTPVTVFDCVYVAGGRNQRTVRQTVAFFEAGPADVPVFSRKIPEYVSKGWGLT